MFEERDGANDNKYLKNDTTDEGEKVLSSQNAVPVLGNEVQLGKINRDLEFSDIDFDFLLILKKKFEFHVYILERVLIMQIFVD